jgi:hypothetical protein
LDVGDNGKPTLANFDPPLQPDIQRCAAETIYKTRFAQAGQHKITLTFRH